MGNLHLKKFDDELLHQAKLQALQQRKTLKVWAEEAIREKLERGK